MSDRAELEALQAAASRLRGELSSPTTRPAELVRLERDNAERLQRCMELRAAVRDAQTYSASPPALDSTPRSLRTLGLAGAIVAFFGSTAASGVAWFTASASLIALVTLGVPLAVNVIRVARAARRGSR